MLWLHVNATMPSWSMHCWDSNPGCGHAKASTIQLNPSSSPRSIIQGCRKQAFWVCTLWVPRPKLTGRLGFSQCSAIVILNPKRFILNHNPHFHCALAPTNHVVGLGDNRLGAGTRLSRMITAFINLGSWQGGLGNRSMLVSGQDMTSTVMKAE